MVIRTFEGEDMNDVLRKVKKALGTDAVILGSQTRRPSGGVGERVVVTAGLPGVDPPWLSAGESRSEPEGPIHPETRKLREEVASLRETVLKFEKDWGPKTRDTVMELVRTVESIAGGNAASGEILSVPGEMDVASALLERAGVLATSTGSPMRSP